MRRIVVGLTEDIDRIFALVDDEDYDRCAKHTWYLNSVGQTNRSMDPYSRYYVRARMNGRKVYLHRYIMGVTNPKLQVHHKDNDPLNNQKINLEVVTQLEHSQFHLGRPW